MVVTSLFKFGDPATEAISALGFCTLPHILHVTAWLVEGFIVTFRMILVGRREWH
jgi:hypothetical protein